MRASTSPSYGNLDFLGSSLDIPIITQTLEELSLSALVPYRNAIATGNLDAMFVGGCGIANPSMNVNHACLSDRSSTTCCATSSASAASPSPSAWRWRP